VIDEDNAFIDERYRKGFKDLQYRDVINWSRYVDMDNSKDREKIGEIAKEIVDWLRRLRKRVIRFTESIALWRPEEDITLERYFKSIIESLKQIVENTIESSKDPIMTEILLGRRWGTKTQKKTTECFVQQFYTGFHAYEINWVDWKSYYPLWTKYLK